MAVSHTFDDNIQRTYWEIGNVATECTRYCRLIYGKERPFIRTSKIRFYEGEFPYLKPKKRIKVRMNYGDFKRKYNSKELYNMIIFCIIMESGDYTIQGAIKKFKEHKFSHMILRLKRLNNYVQMPTYGSKGAACFDLRANQEVVIQPSETKIVPTGLIMEVPEGWEVTVRPRSGMSLKTNLEIANSPGTIDSDYRGEVGVIMKNTGSDVASIQRGDRIAQAKLQKAEQCQFLFVENITDTERGEGGFGSTGNQ